MKKQRLIYALCCPITNEIHYIGKSTKGMIRPLSHLSNTHSDKIREWITDLKELGYTPKIKIIEYVSIEEDIDLRERYWIQYELNKGSLLLNSCLITPLLLIPNLDIILGDGEGMDMLKIGTYIKERRKQVKLTQEQFADKTGVALTVLRKLEQGKTNVNVNGLLQILKMFGSTIHVVSNKKYNT